MGRRRGLGRILSLALLSIPIGGAVIGGFSQLTPFLSIIPADFSTIISVDWTVIAKLSAILAGVYFTTVSVRRLRCELAREAATRKARAATEEHLALLVRRREQLVQEDRYGKSLLDKWTEEIAYFITHHIKPTLTRRERLEFAKDEANITAMINTRVKVERNENHGFKTFPDDMAAKESPPDEIWYYADSEHQLGPLTLDELREMLTSNSNANEVFVWCARFADWKQVGDVPEVKASLHPTLRQVRAA